MKKIENILLIEYYTDILNVMYSLTQAFLKKDMTLNVYKIEIELSY